MKNVKNIACKAALAVTAFVLALCCMSSLSAFAADTDGMSDDAVAVADLAMIDDGYDASASDMMFEIELP